MEGLSWDGMSAERFGSLAIWSYGASTESLSHAGKDWDVIVSSPRLGILVAL